MSRNRRYQDPGSLHMRKTARPFGFPIGVRPMVNRPCTMPGIALSPFPQRIAGANRETELTHHWVESTLEVVRQERDDLWENREEHECE